MYAISETEWCELSKRICSLQRSTPCSFLGLWLPTPIKSYRGKHAEIRIGNIMPYTGPLATFAKIGKAEAAYSI
jgi:hypothetical protein